MRHVPPIVGCPEKVFNETVDELGGDVGILSRISGYSIVLRNSWMIARLMNSDMEFCSTSRSACAAGLKQDIAVEDDKRRVVSI
jgi:hypothetical protein